MKWSNSSNYVICKVHEAVEFLAYIKTDSAKKWNEVKRLWGQAYYDSIKSSKLNCQRYLMIPRIEILRCENKDFVIGKGLYRNAWIGNKNDIKKY